MIERLNAALEGRYRIERELGEGGMATVYLAEDLRHGRKVALKVLKPELAAVVGAERFLAEIRTTAQLQHPHILPLHDSGEADSFLFYVMPYIAGESLREKLEREQQLPVEDALGITEKVAAALQYAHEQGVVHRDIKPANILLSRGEPVVADFGIALAVSQAGAGRITETGLSLGTPHYMSPEQAAGERTLDKRSDVYALGCVLYEMLTGQPPFGGPTAQAVLGRILTGEAEPVTKHRKSVPANVEAAIHKALERLPADRFESARAFDEALRNPAFGAGTARGASGGRPPAATGRWRIAAMAAGALAVLALVAAGVSMRPRGALPVRRYSMELPGQTLAGSSVGRRIDISPDGSTIVYGASGSSGIWQLWLRRRDRLEAQEIAGTVAATMPTFSPDGRHLAFGTRNSSLAVVGLGGEPPLAVEAPGNQTLGLDWGEDDRLYYAGPDGIYRIPSAGGEPERVTRVDTAGGEYLHAFPRLLPGGKGLLYTAVSGVGSDPNASTVAVVDLKTGESRKLMRGIGAGYASSGHVLARSVDGTLLALPLDLKSLEPAGDPVAMLQGVANPVSGIDVALSDEGTLVYVQTENLSGRRAAMVLTRRDGVKQPLSSEWTGDVTSVAVSPSGRRIAASVSAPDGESLWVGDAAGGPPAKRTFQGVSNQRPEWTPDGREIVFYSDRQGGFDLWEVRADGSAPARLLLDEPRDVVEAKISPDGRWLVYRTNALQAPGADILARRRNPDGSLDGEAIPLIARPGVAERAPTFSPDGRWLAYVSDESGRDEIYVRPFPDVENARWQVSVEGATEPLWSRGGGEIFYRRTDTGDLVSVSVRTDPTFAPGERHVLFPASGYVNDYHHRMYDVLPGDTAFLFIPLAMAGANHLVVVDNFFTDLEEKAGR